jgi:hypothetical protein
MKLQLVFLPLVLVWVSVSGLKAQAGSDSVAYSAHFYTVKSGEQNVLDVAKSQQIDPKIVVDLNGFRDAGQALTPGQKIKIPRYLHGYHYILTAADLASGKPAVKKEKPRNKPKPEADEAYSFAIQKNRLMLIDATLELDETLLQGIKASLDSLKEAGKNVIDEKSISVTLRRMQRARDKILLTPYLILFRDSLATDVSRLVLEKTAIQSHLTNTQLQVAKTKDDSTGAAKVQPADMDEDAGKGHMGNDLSPEGTLPQEPEHGASVTREVIVIKHHKKITDSTVSVSAAAAINSPEHKTVQEQPHWESARALEPEWDNAHAVDPVLDSLYRQVNPDLTTIETAPHGQVAKDTQAYIPLASKPDAGNEDTGSLKPMLDSINRLKAAVYLTRAQNALNEKNFVTAETYLKKAIDANPGYYEAWFMLAGLHVRKDLIIKGLKEYEICRTLNAADPQLYYKMANALFRLGKKTEALDNYNMSLKLDSTYLPSMLGSASILMQREEYAAAISKCTKVLGDNLTYHAAYKLRGIAEYMNKDYNAAIDDFTRYLLFDETDPFVYYYRGISKILSKDHDAGCFDLSTSAQLGYDAALKTFRRNCGGK